MHAASDPRAEWHLSEVTAPVDPSEPWGAVWDGIRDCSVTFNLDAYGYDDLADDDIVANRTRYTQQDERIKVWLVALRGPRPAHTPDGRFPGIRRVSSEPGSVPSADDVLATAFLDAPLLDNLHLLEAGRPQTRPSERGCGLEAAFLDAYEVVARTLERSTLLSWVSHRGALADRTADPERTVADPTGTVRLRRDDTTVALLLEHGYSFAQAERHSMQPIPVPEDVLAPAADAARATAAGYELLQWTGLSPDEYLDDLAVLASAMATDPPLGEVDWRPEVWDGARVRRMEERAMVNGIFVSTAVRHIATGRLVGFTQVLAETPKPEVAHQWSTIVLSGHRGHGLGLLLKAANAGLLHQALPAVRRVHTWNADENGWMLRVNVTLGYAVEGIDGCWQKVLS